MLPPHPMVTNKKQGAKNVLQLCMHALLLPGYRPVCDRFLSLPSGGQRARPGVAGSFCLDCAWSSLPVLLPPPRLSLRREAHGSR
jgi:hypothetical protein